MKIRASIIGVGGYTGLELIKLLLNHKHFDISMICGTEETSLDILHTSMKDVYSKDVNIGDIDKISSLSDIVFLALPHMQATKYVKELRKNKIKIVDLSADYRLSYDNYKKYYGNHDDKDNINNATYGLIEYNRENIKNASLVANPGCYPTATLLGLLPFLSFADSGHRIFIDAKSGVSGAGKKLTYNSHFVNINENMFAYSPISHRHYPEIEEQIHKYNNEFKIMFVPHLIPITRGMLVSIYVRLKHEIDPLEILNSKYRDEEFIRIRDRCVQIKDVIGTHFCDIYAQRDGLDLFITSTIDNLLRGASSQALANANIICGLEETINLPRIPYAP